ncbi:MAG: hypothetical protein Fur0010_03890 [Bdellovibrio sp.]
MKNREEVIHDNSYFKSFNVKKLKDFNFSKFPFDTGRGILSGTGEPKMNGLRGILRNTTL